MHRRARPQRRYNPHDAAWHEMQMALGPQGMARDVWGATTWEEQSELARGLIEKWEALHPNLRYAHAYPNPEDRPRSIQHR